MVVVPGCGDDGVISSASLSGSGESTDGPTTTLATDSGVMTVATDQAPTTSDGTGEAETSGMTTRPDTTTGEETTGPSDDERERTSTRWRCSTSTWPRRSSRSTCRPARGCCRTTTTTTTTRSRWSRATR
jgi:hypothetical protein